MRANEDQYGNPTYVKDFAAMLAILLENKEGVFNLVSAPIAAIGIQNKFFIVLT